MQAFRVSKRAIAPHLMAACHRPKVRRSIYIILTPGGAVSLSPGAFKTLCMKEIAQVKRWSRAPSPPLTDHALPRSGDRAMSERLLCVSPQCTVAATEFSEAEQSRT